MASISRYGFAALCLSLLTGCVEGAPTASPEPPVPEDSYVQVMAELTRLRRHPPIAGGQIERDRLADSVRLEILDRHGMTAADMVALADVAGSDPARMQLLAERIASLADSLDADSIRADADRVRLSERPEGSDPVDPVVPGHDPGPRFRPPGTARPRFADPPGPGIPADSTTDANTVQAVDSVPPTGLGPARARPDASRRRPGSRRPTSAPDSAAGRSPDRPNSGGPDGF